MTMKAFPFDKLPWELKMVFFDTCLTARYAKTTDLLAMALVNRSTFELFVQYLKTLPEMRQQGIRDLAGELFKSKFRQEGKLYYKLLELSGKSMDSIRFLMDLPKDVQLKMYNSGQFKMPYFYPSDIPVEELKEKLNEEVLTSIWLSVLDHEDIHDHCFIDPDDTDYMEVLRATEEIGLDEAHKHLSKLTDYMLIIYKDTLNVTTAFLRSLCYWQLYMQLMDIGNLAKHYKTHLNSVLPWILLLSTSHRYRVLVKLSERFQVEHYNYLKEAMEDNPFREMAKYWYKHSNFQKFIRQIPVRDNYSYLTFLKENDFIIMT